ncbi:MAG: hypothetical protein JSV36_11490, partial [Anaerolineae bacterium]
MSRVSLVHQFAVENVVVQVFDDKEALGAAAADFVAERLRQALAERGEATVILATGASQYEFLAAIQQV